MRNMRGKLEHILEGRGVREGSLTKRRAGKPRRQTQTGFRGVLHTWVRYGWATRWSRPSSAASSTFGLRSPRHSSSSTARVLTPRFPPLCFRARGPPTPQAPPAPPRSRRGPPSRGPCGERQSPCHQSIPLRPAGRPGSALAATRASTSGAPLRGPCRRR